MAMMQVLVPLILCIVQIKWFVFVLNFFTSPICQLSLMIRLFPSRAVNILLVRVLRNCTTQKSLGIALIAGLKRYRKNRV